MSSAETSTKTTEKEMSSGLPALAAAAASGRRGGRMPPPASPSTPHVPAQASAAAGEAADAEPAALAAPAVNAAADAAQCRYDALVKYDAAAAKYEAKIGTGEATAFKELKDEAYANLQSANEYLLTFRSIPDAAMSSSRMLELQEVTMPAGDRKRQKLGMLRSCLVGV
jgi:hypothetical protein